LKKELRKEHGGTRESPSRIGLKKKRDTEDPAEIGSSQVKTNKLRKGGSALLKEKRKKNETEFERDQVYPSKAVSKGEASQGKKLLSAHSRGPLRRTKGSAPG